MRHRKIIFILLSIVFFIAASFFAYKIIDHSLTFKSYRVHSTEILDGKTRLTSLKEWGNALMGWQSETQAEGGSANITAAEHYKTALAFAYLLAVMAVLYVGATLFLFARRTCMYKNTSFALVIASFVFLVIGITAPMMEMGAFVDKVKFDIGIKEIEFDGHMHFFYQNKSIINVIHLLFSSGNFIVGTAILLFSIVTPLLKLIFTLVLLLRKKEIKNKFILWVIANLGKWSMADVMVVSIILAFLTFQKTGFGIDTDAHLLLGLYFFLSFVILSIISSMLLKTSLKKYKETVIVI